MNPAALELYRRLVPYGGTMMNETEAVALYEAAQRTEYTLIEIGSYYGLSTAMIAAGMPRKDQLLFAIDPHEGQVDTSVEATWVMGSTIARMLDTLRAAHVQDRVAILPMSSRKANVRCVDLWDWKAGLVFIDGSHQAEDVFNDLRDYAPLVVIGGFLIVDDLGHSEVMKGYAEWLAFCRTEQSPEHFEPVDLREWGIVDPIHNRLHEGATGKTTFFRRVK
jgi:cephalosporin hydroxylase